MLIRDTRGIPRVPPAEITPRAVFLDRRAFLGRVGAAGATTAALALGIGCGQEDAGAATPPDTITDRADVTRYNNFYEFGLDKEDPARNAHTLKTSPWSVRIRRYSQQ